MKGQDAENIALFLNTAAFQMANGKPQTQAIAIALKKAEEITPAKDTYCTAKVTDNPFMKRKSQCR